MVRMIEPLLTSEWQHAEDHADLWEVCVRDG